MKKTAVASGLVVCSVLAIAVGLVSCGLTGGTTYTTHPPKFLVGVETGSGHDINVYSVTPSSGALTAVSGSPFDLGVGLADPYEVITHPNGQWVYVCDYTTNLVAAFSLNSSGTPTGITSANMTTTSGCDWTQGVAITPDGKYLYAAETDSWISVFAIDQSTGALTAKTGFHTGGSELIGIAATDSYVFAADLTTDHVYIEKIGSDGTLTAVTSVAVPSTDQLASAALDVTGKYLYVGDRVGKLFGYSVGSDGSLTALAGNPVSLAAGGSSATAEWQIAFSLDNKFIYVADASNGVHALSFDESTGAASELSASPYANAGNSAHGVVVDPSNQYVYSDSHCTNIAGWVRDTSTGALSGRMDTTTTTGGVCAVTVTY